jgi:hypothetical protein
MNTIENMTKKPKTGLTVYDYDRKDRYILTEFATNYFIPADDFKEVSKLFDSIFAIISTEFELDALVDQCQRRERDCKNGLTEFYIQLPTKQGILLEVYKYMNFIFHCEKLIAKISKDGKEEVIIFTDEELMKLGYNKFEFKMADDITLALTKVIIGE